MTDRSEPVARLEAAVAGRAGAGDSLDLSQWDRATWEALLAPADLVALGNGDILIQSNETGRDLFFVVDGALEVSVPQMTSMSTAPGVRIEAGSIVGEVSFFDAHQRTASVWSRGPSTLFRLPHSGFEVFRRTHPERSCDLIYAIARVLAWRLRQAQGVQDERPAQRKRRLF
jgi:CRP-like cAMP-binding protein